MDSSEKIKICSSCSNREFNPECGIVCSLTKEKPNFEEACENYSANQSQLAKKTADSIENAELDSGNKRISGWLAFFLWIGVGVGATITAIINTAEIASFGVSSMVGILGLVFTAAILTTAIYTIVAFLRRQSNAVAVAKTYTAMVFLDGVMALIIGLISDDTSSPFDSLRGFIWAITWFLYLTNSKKVKRIIPRETRTYRAFEKILLIIFTTACISFTSLISYVVATGDAEVMFDDKTSYISAAIKEANKALPEDLGDGIIWQKAICEENNVVYVYKLKDCYESGTDLLSSSELEEERQETIKILKSENDPFMNDCFENGYNIVFRYTNAIGAELYSITITPEDFNNFK